MSGPWTIVLVLLAVAIAYTQLPYPRTSQKGLRVIVCGASTGIGEQLAYNYAQLNASVTYFLRLILSLRVTKILIIIHCICILQ